MPSEDAPDHFASVEVQSVEAHRAAGLPRPWPGRRSQAKVGEFGADVVWPGGLDMSNNPLWRLAQEQAGLTKTAEAFRRWRERRAFTLDTAARALGISRRMVAYYERASAQSPALSR